MYLRSRRGIRSCDDCRGRELDDEATLSLAQRKHSPESEALNEEDEDEDERVKGRVEICEAKTVHYVLTADSALSLRDERAGEGALARVVGYFSDTRKDEPTQVVAHE